MHLGGIDATPPDPMPDDINAAADESPLRTLDRDAEAAMIARIDTIKRAGNTLGGICEVVCRRAARRAGLARLVGPEARRTAGRGDDVDSRGEGRRDRDRLRGARRTGAEVHDEIEPAPGRTLAGNVRRKTNRAGGLEGGMTTGEPLVVRVAMKPISTLMRPLATVDVATGEAAAATAERSDVTAVPAMGVIAEAMVAFVLAQAALEKFGGDSLAETRRNYDGYISHVADRLRH